MGTNVQGATGSVEAKNEAEKTPTDAGAAPPAPVSEPPPSAEDAGVSAQPWILKYHLIDPSSLESLQAVPSSGDGDFVEVSSSEEAGALLADCPADCVVCCTFFLPHSTYLPTLFGTLRELISVEPAGIMFVSVDMQAAPQVAKWAGVSFPLVRFLRSDGHVLDEARPEVGKNALLQKALSIAASNGKAAVVKVKNLSARFPGALRTEMLALPAASTDVVKMQQNGMESLKVIGATDAERSSFDTLCKTCGAGSQLGAVARVRDVANLARVLHRVPAASALPILDLVRRLGLLKLLRRSGDPGSWKALELLLDAALCCAFEGEDPDLTLVFLSLQLVTSCFMYDPMLSEAMLPIVSRIVETPGWSTIWKAQPPGTLPSGKEKKARDSAGAMALNASVALHSARCRSEHSMLVCAFIDALHREPKMESLNQAVGNLLVTGGTQEDAKRALQAQPEPPLRALAAAVFRGDLNQPEDRAFPLAWQPPAPPPPPPGQDGDPRDGDRGGGRGGGYGPPRRAPIPARHRGRGGG